MTDTADSRLRLWQGQVLPEWLDYNGHMTEHRYLQAFGESSDKLYEILGVDFVAAEKGAWYTLETHIRHLSECKVGTGIHSDTEILGYDQKRLHLYHRLFDREGKILATGEHLAVHVRGGKSAPASEEMLACIHGIFASRRNLPAPEGTGGVLRRPLGHAR